MTPNGQRHSHWRQPVQAVKAKPLVLRQLGVALLALVVALGVFWMSFQDIASLTRNHKHLRYMINPFNSVYAVTRLFVGQATLASQPLQVIGQDAQLAQPAQPLPVSATDRGPLMVVVLGETARAANFGLGGYARDTTPQLRKLQAQGDLTYFSDVKSCGTSTQASVPCMFSHLGKSDFEGSNQRFESVLDVLQRAGLAVLCAVWPAARQRLVWLVLALAVVTELSDYVSPFLILRLLRLMLPPVLLVLAVFLLALPLRGLSGLFGGLSAAATLLAMVAAGATATTRTGPRL